MLTRESLIEWATSWVGGTEDGNKKRFAEALAKELEGWQPPPQQVEWCANCPFAKHVHYEEGGKLVAPGCTGFAPKTLAPRADGCICHGIIGANETRHFKECPLRATYHDVRVSVELHIPSYQRTMSIAEWSEWFKRHRLGRV